MNKPTIYNTPLHLNKNIKILGLEGSQLLVTFVALLISFFIYKPLPILIFFPLTIVLSKINRQIKIGNPSPVESFLLKKKTKKNLIDTNCVLKQIANNGRKIN